LMEKEFSDTAPLLYLCKVYDFYDDMLPYLYELKDLTSIAIYIIKCDTSTVPQTFAFLLDNSCHPKTIVTMLK